jgi:hypothetical protein
MRGQAALVKLSALAVVVSLYSGRAAADGDGISLDIVVQGTMRTIIQGPSGIRDSSWSAVRRIPSCTMLPLRNTATGTPMVHIEIADAHAGEYEVKAISAGRALAIAVKAGEPGRECRREDDVKAPASGAGRSWTVAVPDTAGSECPFGLRRRDTKVPHN